MQNRKVAGYLRAKRLIDAGATQTDACDEAGISRMTFNKYRKMFGDEVSEGKVEVLPKEEKKPVPVVNDKESSLDKIVKENAILAENLRLKKELGLLN